MPGLRVETTEVDGEAGIASWAGGEITQVLVVRNPDELRGLSVGSAG